MTYCTGKTAVITGAGSGIGRALALQLNSQGCELHLSDISTAGLEETLAALPRPEVKASSLQLDVADRQAVYAWAEHIAAVQGHVDIVINNAGVAYTATVEESDDEHQQWLMNINFWGVVYGTQAFLPLLGKSQQGHLLNISSVFGLIGVRTQSIYNAAKFAVRGYTEALRQELDGSNIHICCVHPGGIKTNIARSSRGSALGESADERNANFEKHARTTAESAAAQMIQAIEKRKKRLLIGADAKYISLVSRLFPVNYPGLLPGPIKPEITGKQ